MPREVYKLNFFQNSNPEGEIIPLIADAFDVTGGDNAKGSKIQPIYLDDNGHTAECNFNKNYIDTEDGKLRTSISNACSDVNTELTKVSQMISFNLNQAVLTITINTYTPTTITPREN